MRALILIASIAVVGCSVRSVNLTPSSSGLALSPSVAPTANMTTARPAASPAPTLAGVAFEDLPRLTVDRTGITVLCDPPPGGGLSETQPLIYCNDGVELGLRAMQLVVRDPIERAYLEFPDCGAVPCTVDKLEAGTFTAWTATAQWTAQLDARSNRVSLPIQDPEPRWPTLAGEPPAVDRPDIEEAPLEVADREPLPFCGHDFFDEPPGPKRCFLAELLAGRPVEMIETLTGTEGGSAPRVIRFGGAGTLTTYTRYIDSFGNVGGWYTQPNYVHLGFEEGRWGVDPWSVGRDLP